MTELPQASSSDVRQALDQIGHSGRQLLADQLALIGAEAREGLDGAVNRLIEAVVAILLGLCGFVVLTFSGIRLLELYLGQPLACGLVGTAYILTAVLLTRASAGKRLLPDEDDAS